jgi:diadenosine tetraphosphate (Ap4A) HIT family hydrolase
MHRDDCSRSSPTPTSRCCRDSTRSSRSRAARPTSATTPSPAFATGRAGASWFRRTSRGPRWSSRSSRSIFIRTTMRRDSSAGCTRTSHGPPEPATSWCAAARCGAAVATRAEASSTTGDVRPTLPSGCWPRSRCCASAAGTPRVLTWDRREARRASSRGHCLFFPRRHAPRLDDLDTAETAELFGLVHRVAKALGVEHYNVISNNGDRAGQTVFHAHAHIVPKPNAGIGLVQQVGLGVVDQGGMAEELKRRLEA